MKKLNLIPKNPYAINTNTVDINEEDIALDFFKGIQENTLEIASGENIAVRSDSQFNGMSIFLSSEYNYILGFDNSGTTILVPLKKKQS